MKTTLAVIVCVSMLMPAVLFAAEEPPPPKDLVVGRIVQSLDGKFKMLTGDKAMTNLGARQGVIKGDIFTVYYKDDGRRVDPIGECAVVEIDDTRSICEVISMKRDIGMDIITLKKMQYDDALLFPSVFALLTKVVEPYPPEKKINVYIHDVFDEKNNVTKFSEKVKKEIRKVFFQKPRIKTAGTAITPAIQAYLPGEYNEYTRTIEEYLKKDKIDVIVSAAYRISGDKVELSYYKIDKNYEDVALDTVIAAQPYTALAAQVTVPYRERRKEQTVTCDVIYKPVYHKTVSRDERNSIIDYETRGNPILEYTVRRSEFNILAPVDFVLKIDGNEMKFDKTREYRIPLTTGSHQIGASYKKGFYFNDTFLVALPDELTVKKDAVITIERPEDLVIEIEANPFPRRDNLTFKVYRKVTRSTTIIKPVMTRETINPVETFKD